MSSFSVLTVVVFIVSAATTATGSASCSIKRFGKLTMFSRERGNVELPCKYRLAELTCGNHIIKVTVGSSLDGDNVQNRFSPSTAWVKVIKTTTGKFWTGRTAAKLLENATSETAVWTEKEGELSFDTEGYDEAHQAAVLTKEDKFDIAFSTGSDDAGVTVTCHLVDKMTSKPYPDSLCGDGSKGRVLPARRQSLFGIGHDDEETRSRTLTHDILTNRRVKQSKVCNGVARRFQGCKERTADAARVCSPLFGSRSLAKCVIESEDDVRHFDDCVASVCDPSAISTCYSLKTTIQTKCAQELAHIPGLGC